MQDAHEGAGEAGDLRLLADAALVTLRQAQDDLVRSEKLASLGQLVAGVSHEISTPLGIALTTSTQVEGEAAAFEALVSENRLSRSRLVQHAVSEYPFRSTRERECVQVRVREDFRFDGSQALFLQVIDNLVKNALRSLASSKSAPVPGDLVVEVHRQDGRGYIVVADRGVGLVTAPR